MGHPAVPASGKYLKLQLHLNLGSSQVRLKRHAHFKIRFQCYASEEQKVIIDSLCPISVEWSKENTQIEWFCRRYLLTVMDRICFYESVKELIIQSSKKDLCYCLRIGTGIHLIESRVKRVTLL